MGYLDEYYKLKKKREEQMQKSSKSSSTSTSADTSTDSPYLNTYNQLKAEREAKIDADLMKMSAMANNDSDIGPVIVSSKDKKEETEKKKWFNSGLFDDGYQFGDVAKTILGTGSDLAEDALTGIIGMGEKIVDAGAFVAPYIAQGQFYQNGGAYQSPAVQKTQNEMFEQSKKESAAFMQKDLYNENAIAKKLLSEVPGAIQMSNINQAGGYATAQDWERNRQMQEESQKYIDNTMEDASVFGDKSDALVQSAGQLVATAGLQAVGVPWWLTTGLTSFGAEAENALNQGATYEEAGLSAAITAGAEILTEKISGGIKFGGKTLDEGATRQLSRVITNKLARNLSKIGMDVVGEGGEEVLSGYLSAIGQKLTYADEKEMNELFSSEDALDAFIGGAILGGVSSTGQAIAETNKGNDYASGLTNSEKAVVDKVYKDAIAEKEADGKKLSQSEKSKIYDDTLKALEKGYIDTDTIESVIGGETYNTYKSTVESEDALQKEYDELYHMKNGEKSDAQRDRQEELKKQLDELKTTSKRTQLKEQLDNEVLGLVQGSKLSESYNEKARRKQKFEADLDSYTNESAKQTVKNFMEKTKANNSNRAHDYVDMLTRISEDRGHTFDFMTTAQLEESIANGNPHNITADPKRIEAFVSGKGKTIIINMDANKSFTSLVGHETAHTLEGAGHYEDLQKVLFKLAETKGEYADRLASIQRRYSKLSEAEQQRELTADLLGDYIFNDTDFIKSLSTEKPNILKRIYNEIKYLYKMATAGSKEARELEQVKKTIEQVWRENGTTDSDKVQFSLTNKNITEETEIPYTVDTSYHNVAVNDNAELVKLQNEVKGITRGTYENKATGYKADINATTLSKIINPTKSFNPWDAKYNYIENLNAAKHLPELFENAVYIDSKPPQKTKNVGKQIKEYHHFVAPIEMNNNEYRVLITAREKVNSNTLYVVKTEVLPNTKRGASVVGQEPTNMIGAPRTISIADLVNGVNIYDYDSQQNVAYSDKDIKYSSVDSDGKQLTQEQQEFFKDSKVRDDNGNLMVVYHGSKDYGFTVFDPSKSDDKMSLFFTNDENMANSYVGDKEKLYKTYLNLKNPYIVDAKGHRWNQIRLGENTDAITGKVERFVDLAMRYDVEIDFALVGENLGSMSDSVEFMFENELENLDEGETSLYSDAEKAEMRQLAAEIDDAYENWDEEAHLDEDGEPTNMRQYLFEHKLSTAYTTRQIAKIAKDQGNDGVIIKNVYDNGKFTSKTGIHGFGNVYIAFDSNQVKSVDNANPTSDPDIRYSLSEDSEGRGLSPVVKSRFANSKAVDENGNLKVLYHGTASGEFTIFDKSKGSVEGDFGSGFYFTDNDSDVSEHYEGGGPDFENKVARRAEQIEQEEDIDYDEALERAREELYKGSHKFEVYLNIENPAIVGETVLFDNESYLENYNEEDYEDYDDYIADVEQALADDIENIVWEVEKNVDVYSTDGLSEVLFDAYYEGGIGIEELKAKINDLYLEDSNGNMVGNEVARQIIESLGYDGIIDPTVSTKWNMNMEDGTTHYIVFKPNQIKAVTNENPTDNPDIHKSLSETDIAPSPYGGYNVFGKDIALEQDIGPVMEAAPTTEAVEPSAEVYAPLTEAEANERDDAQIDRKYFLDEMAPEPEAPIYSDDIAPESPFDDRDYETIGNRKIKAYMYENPEVKPFFQEEAWNMLHELSNSQKGERGYNDDLYYETNGEMGFYGVKRHTSEDIAYLLDKKLDSYADIERGLKAIIEDHGEENNATSKRIEFLLDERLRSGYRDFFTGERIPPNQEYLNLLTEKQITEYNDEAWDNFLRGLSQEDMQQYFGPEEEIAPPVQSEPEIAPVREDLPLHEDATGQQTMFEVEDAETEPTITRSALHGDIIDNIKSVFNKSGFDLDTVLNKAKDLSTFATVDNTPQRVIEKALGYKQGQILNDLTVNKVAQNETEGTKWLDSFTNRKNGLLAQISKQYNIKPGSKKSAAAQMYAEGFYVDEDNNIIAYGNAELEKDFPKYSDRADIRGLARDPRIRKIYDDTLAMINESRKRNAYPEIPRLDNYFLHFRAMDDTFSRLGLPFNPNDIRAKDLPTDLNGVTADLKPGQPYFASAMHRTGKRTSFDLLGGLERYLSSAKNQIYHIDDIQTLRALRNYIADTYGQAKGLEGLDALTEEEAQERIEEVYGSHLSTFAKFLNEEANVIAGKTTLIDRGLEGVIGRRGITFLDTINRQVGANMVGFNISSSLTNFLPVAQTFAKTNKADFVKAFAQTVSNKIGSVFGRNDGFAEQSPVMIRRKGADRFYRTPWQKLGDAGYVFMGAVDSISTELITRTKYNELTRKGMDSQKAHYETDKWVSRMMGDRSLGQQPQLYNSKMLGIFTKFQLEVRNQLDSQFYDTIQEAKVSNEDIQNGLARNAKTAAKVTSAFVQLAVVQHLFGKAFESVAGYNPAFDIIAAILKAVGYDDDEESEDTVLDNLEQGFLELLGDLPYTSTFTGGRIPIASALPVEQFITGKDDYGNEKSRLETIKEAAPYYVLPAGYGQIKKTYQGLSMFDDDLPIAGSYTDSGNLRYPVEDTLQNRVQAGVFGQWASDNARDYFDNERNPLKEKQIEELVDLDIPIADYWKYREGLAEQETLEDKFDYIADLDVSVEQKNIMINNVVDRKEKVDMSNYDDFSGYDEFDFYAKNTDKYNFLQDNGVSYSEYISNEDAKKEYDNAYSWYKNNPEKVTVSKAVTDNVIEYRRFTSELNEIRADKDADGDSITGSAKEKKIAYINGLDLDYGQRIILFRSYYDGKEDKETYNADIVEYLNGRDDISYEEMVTILEELDFKVYPDGTVEW